MTSFDKHLMIALTLSTALMVFNMYAVTTGLADSYYAQVSDWLAPIFRPWS